MSTSDITVFDRNTGAIRCCSSIPAGTEDDQCLPGEDWIFGMFSGAEWRIDPASRDPLPLLEFALAISTNHVSGVPFGSQVMLNGTVYDAPADGEITITVSYPQVLRGYVTNRLYHALEIEVPCAPVN